MADLLDIMLDTWMLLVEEALEVLPFATEADLSDPERANRLEGQDIHEELQPLIGTPAKFQALFGTQFSVVPNPKKPDEQFGDGKNKDGAVYLVANAGTTAIFKAVPAVKGEMPREFRIQKELHKSPKYNGKTVKPFVPQPIENNRSTDKEYDFMIMEKLGPTLETMVTTTDAKKKLLPTDTPGVLTRALLILRAIHEAGYVHGDAHAGNWAVSETDQTILALFDFGRAQKLTPTGDWMPAFVELRAWVGSLARWLVVRRQVADAATTAKFTTMITEANKLLNQYSWQNPHYPQVSIPFADFKLDSRKAFYESPVVAEFNKIANAAIDEKSYGFDSVNAITQWSAANAKTLGHRRRRGNEPKAAAPALYAGPAAIEEQPKDPSKRIDFNWLQTELTKQMEIAKKKTAH